MFHPLDHIPWSLRVDLAVRQPQPIRFSTIARPSLEIRRISRSFALYLIHDCRPLFDSGQHNYLSPFFILGYATPKLFLPTIVTLNRSP